jgi:hypothetical protein
MTLRVVGAGVGRTGTMSLKLALERLLGGPCHHMMEVFTHPEQIPGWHAAARGEPVDWKHLLAGYRAAVDWPSSAFWPELAVAFPDAIVVHSVREPDAWWESASQTIFRGFLDETPRGGPPFMAAWHAMAKDMFANRFTLRIDDREAALAALARHDARVRAEIPSARRLEFRATDGWAPLCAALGVPVPAEPFPRTNTREEWLARVQATTRVAEP